MGKVEKDGVFECIRRSIQYVVFARNGRKGGMVAERTRTTREQADTQKRRLDYPYGQLTRKWNRRE